MDEDCTNRCRSKSHAGKINSVIQSSGSDLAKFWIQACKNSFRGGDTAGRNILHIASCCGKLELVTWILERTKQLLNAKDKESGWTALHRALFYGQITCAVHLMKAGASIAIKDNESLTALEICSKDRYYLPFTQTHKEIGSYDVYTWGDNQSYTLGHGKESRAVLPTLVESFRRKHMSIVKVVMGRNHSVFLTSAGVVFTCGHGRGGRLGLGHQEPTLYPLPVKFPNQTSAPSAAGDNEMGSIGIKVIDVATGRDHTLFLCSNGKVYSCGLNEHKQLGIFPDVEGKVTEPKMVNSKTLQKIPSIKFIAASRFHSAIATESAVYTFGLNAGQLGHAKGERHVLPRLVTSLELESILHLESCDAATVVVNRSDKREGFYILYGYSCKFISLRGAKFDKSIVKLSVSGGCLDHSVLPELLRDAGGCSLKIVWINRVGQLFLWNEQSNSTTKVIYSALGRQLFITDVCSSLNEILFTAEDGDAYILTYPDKLTEVLPKDKFQASVPYVDLKIRQVAGVHRAVACCMDSKSSNYSLLQAKEYTCLFVDVGESKMMEEYDSLLKSCDEMDGVCDVVLVCQKSRIPCHKYILASRSTYFRKLLLSDRMDGTSGVPLDAAEINEGYSENTMFSRHLTGAPSITELQIDSDIKTLTFVLQFIYKNKAVTSLVLPPEVPKASSGKNNQRSKNSKDVKPKEDPSASILRNICNKFGIKTPVSHSQDLSCPKFTFTMSKFSQWCDVVLKASDGKELTVHKCVLVARMEYFRGMFSGHWHEGCAEVTRLEFPIPGDILYAVMQYIYTDGDNHLEEKDDIEFLVNVLIVADQLLLPRLKQMCEKLIISKLTIDNVVQVYQLSAMYNSEQLKEAAKFMICLNLSEILELSLLHDLDTQLLDELSSYYRDKLRCMGRRFLGKSSNCPGDEELDRVLSDQQDKTSTPTKKPRRRSRNSSSSNSESEVKATNEPNFSLDEDQFTEEFDTSSNSLNDLNLSFTNISLSNCSTLSHSEGLTKKATQEKADQSLRLESPQMNAEITEFNSVISDRCVSKATIASKPDLLSLREIMSHQIKKENPAESSVHNSKLKAKPLKRKQYRSLLLEEASDDKSREQAASSLIKSPSSPWINGSSKPVTSLKEVMKSEQNNLVPEAKSRQPDHNTLTRSETLLSKPMWSGQPINKPDAVAADPAKLTKQSMTTPKNQHAIHNLQDIISEETKNMEALAKSVKKPLALVQIEERAMEELRKTYEAIKSPHELITVERVAPTLASPLWLDSRKS